MQLSIDNDFQHRESSLTKALRQIQQLKSKLAELEQQHQDYVRSQQELIPAFVLDVAAGIADICPSLIQEVEALRILVYRGEAECRRYLRSLLVNRKKAS
ncbi:hypothetical protein [Nostoc sp. MG11]|uniref:hypothetical protein n=1 Tax=Nostoc sp. MG11 TaxID=2721166 RepID=UPI0018674D4F|nr:hypothetical protein [Nostoc sp. MG11]